MNYGFWSGNYNSEKIKKVISEHPDLPVVFGVRPFVSDEYETVFTDDIEIEVGEIFDSDQWEYGHVFTDRKELEDTIRDRLEYSNYTEDEIQYELFESEKLWRDAIIVYLKN